MALSSRLGLTSRRPGGVLAREEQVEERSQGVDVGGGRDAAAGELLRGGVLRRQRAAPLPRQGRRLAHARAVFEQLRDAEVEELDLAVLRDEDVRRLDVPVDDEVRMGVRDGGADVEEESQPLLDAETPRVAVSIDRLAVDELENDVRLARRRDPRIAQARDVRMGQLRENRALPPESLFSRPAHETRVQEFHGDAPFEAAVAAPREPDAAHAALADRLDQRVGSDRLAGERGLRGRLRRCLLEKAALARGRRSPTSSNSRSAASSG